MTVSRDLEEGREGAGATEAPAVALRGQVDAAQVAARGLWARGRDPDDARAANSGLSASEAENKQSWAVNVCLVILPVTQQTGKVPALMEPASREQSAINAFRQNVIKRKGTC